MEITIDIDDYLSEEDKKDIAKEAFTDSIRKGLLEKERLGNKTNYDNYERVISNSIHHYLEEKIDSILDCNHIEIIKESVLKTIKKKDYSYSLFRVKSAWEKEDSPAQKISNAAIQSHREVMTKKIHKKLDEAVEELGVDNLHELFSSVFDNFLAERLTSKL